jgi:hypothetical protein
MEKTTDEWNGSTTHRPGARGRVLVDVDVESVVMARFLVLDRLIGYCL